MKRSCTAALAALWLLSLTGCERLVPSRLCPEPVYPSEEALVWFEQSNPPPAVVEFLDMFDRQQQVIEACHD
jgi:hypothetical protein